MRFSPDVADLTSIIWSLSILSIFFLTARSRLFAPIMMIADN